MGWIGKLGSLRNLGRRSRRFNLRDGVGAQLSISREFSTDSEGLHPPNEVSEGAGKLWTWGKVESGQLGQGDEETRRMPSRVRPLSLPTSNFSLDKMARRLSPGAESKPSEAVDSSYKSHEHMEVDASSEAFGSQPFVKSMHASARELDAGVGIACGFFHSGFWKDGRLWLWGNGAGGRFALGCEDSQYSPAQVTGLRDVTGLALKGLHYAANADNGSQHTWVFEGFVILGHGNYSKQLSPQKLTGEGWMEIGKHIAEIGSYTAADVIPAFKSAEDVAILNIDRLPSSLCNSTLPGRRATAGNLWAPRSPLLIEYHRARADLTENISFVRSFHATTSAIDASRVCSSTVSTPLDPKQLRGHDFLLEGSIGSRRFFSSNQQISDDSQGKSSTSERLESISADKSTETTYKSWIQSALPEKFWPYAQLARLDKPIGSWLLAWPCVWSICLAAPSGSLPDPVLLGLFVTGAFLLRGAGCTVNDLWDRDIDKLVERTRDRPLASGALTPFQGLSFLALQLSAGLGILLQLNLYSQALGVMSVLLFGTYPLMKRVTFWPQAYLGATFNWGTLMGWAAVHGSLQLSAVLPLYAAGICWTLVYDTIYAHQDKEDDVRVGVKSTALLFGTQTQTWLAGFSTACIANLALAGWNCNLGWPFYLGLAGAAGHLGWQVLSVDIHNGSDCNSKFVSNKWFGAIVATGVVLGKIASLPA